MKLQNQMLESGDATALICVRDGELQALVADQLSSSGYTVQMGLFREDVALRLQTNAYDVLVVEEGFENVEGEWNPIIMDSRELPPERRRSVFIVLFGPDFKSSDGMQAFQHSVDLVVSVEDLGRLAGMLLRNFEDHQQRYQPFHECAEQALTM